MSNRSVKSNSGSTTRATGSKSASVQTNEMAAWNSFLCSAASINTLKSQLRTSITKDIVGYMTNPMSHPDIISKQSATPTVPSPIVKGSKPVSTTSNTILHHKDGFEKAPLFQSTLVTVQTQMQTRIGGRGLVATADIQPGTLLLCEYIRHPFQQGLKADDGTPIRPEVEFVQEFCFDLTNTQRVELLVDFASLFPFKHDEIEPDHRDFLLYVYGDLLEECLKHLVATGKHIITFPSHLSATFSPTIEINQNLLLRLICVIHFNSFPSGMLLHTSMINHNCQPNAVKLFIPRPEIVNNSKQFAKVAKCQVHNALYQPKQPAQRVYSELRATTLIRKGEEIFISYIPSHLTDLTVQQRQTYLYRQFRFNCDCLLCGFETKELAQTTHPQEQHHHQQQQQQQRQSHQERQEQHNDNDGDTAVSYLTSLAFGTYNEASTAYDFDSNATLSTKTTWIDELTRNYVNFTSGQSHESIERQHAAYLKATKRAKDLKLADNDDFMTSTATTTDPNHRIGANDGDGDRDDDDDDDDDHNNSAADAHNDGGGHDDDDSDDEAQYQDDVKHNANVLMSFRELYGLPAQVNVQVYILLQAVPILYPYLFPSTSNGGDNINIHALNHIELQQLLTKCHKLILMVTTDLLQHIQNDLSIETISLLLYLYMLTQPQSQQSTTLFQEFITLSLEQSKQEQQQQQQQLPPPTISDIATLATSTAIQSKPLLPWAGAIHLSSILTELDISLIENANGYEEADSSCNNNGTCYVLGITQRIEASNDENWTVDRFLHKAFATISKLILPSDIITSHPTLAHTDSDLSPGTSDALDLLVEPALQDPNPSRPRKVHTSMVKLLSLLKPIAQTLISQYAERVVASIHLTVTTIGLISSLFNAQYHLRLNQLITKLKEPPTTVSSESKTTPTSIPTPTPAPTTVANLFNLQISLTYNQILFNILYYLQNFQPHHAFASKILRMPLLKDLIGKSPADATRFAEALETIHFKICDLYNLCPIETITKGV